MTQPTDTARQSEIVALRQAGASMGAIGRQLGLSVPTVRKYVRAAGFEKLRTGRPRWRDFSDDQMADMDSLWKTGKSLTAIAQQFGTDKGVVSRLLKQRGAKLEPRHGNHMFGSRSTWWKGGRVRLGDYVAVGLPVDSPYFVMQHSRGYVMEHRLVMAQALGRPLTDKETVHHMNGNKQDNRLENLQLRHGKHGNGEAWRCAECGSVNIVSVPLEPVLANQLALI